jgi:transcription antitermination factor NusG
MKPVDPTKAWYVVRCNIKCEAKAADNIRLAGFDVYFPRMRFEKKHRRTNLYTEHERPLMISYIFVGMPRDDKLKHFGFVRACEGVEKFLEYQGKPIPVLGADVQELYLAEVDMKFDDTRAARIHRKEEAATRKATIEMKYQRGREFTIVDGPFATFAAVVEEVTKSGNIKAMVNLFGRLTSAEFEAAQLSAA